MGCVVNGPGEAREADFGIAGGKKEGHTIQEGKDNKAGEGRRTSLTPSLRK